MTLEDQLIYIVILLKSTIINASKFIEIKSMKKRKKKKTKKNKYLKQLKDRKKYLIKSYFMSSKDLLESVKKLREITGVGFKDCKLAIDESNGDHRKSYRIFKKKRYSKSFK